MRSGWAVMRPTPRPRCPGGVLVRDLIVSHDICMRELCDEGEVLNHAGCVRVDSGRRVGHRRARADYVPRMKASACPSL
jgi:hypothetical protein